MSVQKPGDEDAQAPQAPETTQTPEAPAAAPAQEARINAEQGEIRQDSGTEAKEVEGKLTADASFDELSENIPAMQKMIGMDQRSDFHSLTLDEHTKEVARRLAKNPFVQEHPNRDLILLAGNLHDLGKTSPEGTQVHPKDSEKRKYVGHEKESARMIAEILPEHFVGLSENDQKFVAGLAGLHASALDLVGNFTGNNQPKGKALKAYDKFMAKAEELPGDTDLEGKMRVIFALNRADKLAGFNEASDRTDEKVAGIIQKAEKQVAGLDELEKALPVLIQAIKNRRGGDENAGIVFENGEYKLAEAKKTKATPVMDGKQIGLVMKNLDELGVPNKDKGGFGKALREGGIPGLGKAGLGRYIGPVKKLLAENS